ncbi:MAG TPA: tripartite tricarboxylate transporter substrate binding protein [Burkholderiales bacterium]|nr:tripartite tricarboxylate transporter substrate binding protein [Burkholderiales bacterium]
MTGKRIVAAAAALAAAMALGTAQAQWKPTKPINIIVPWAAGGATDQVTRVAAGELEDALGTKIVVINQPGASGSIGTMNAMNAPRDGYTWTAGAPKQLGTYPVLGLAQTKLDDFHLFLSVTQVPIVSVNPGSPYQNFQQLLDAMKANPGQITIATAGNTSSGHIAAEAIAKATGWKYRHVTYDGGNPAVISTVAGETQVTTQLASEQAEMIKGKRLRPLAVVGSQPLEIEGYGTIPPITNWVKGVPSVDTAFGIFIPKGAPPEVAATVEKAWNDRVAKSEKLRAYAKARSVLFTPMSGKQAHDAVWPTVVTDAWIISDAGMAKVAPDKIGIPKQ